MNGIKLPPFYVGQRVVCTCGDFSEDGVVKDATYIVKEGGFTCSKCQQHYINIGVPTKTTRSSAECCGITYEENFKSKSYLLFDARGFAPVQENFQSITLEKVLENETPLISVN